MSETATYKQTTFANVQNTLEQFESNQSQSPAPEPTPAHEPTPTTVNESGVIETAAPTPAHEPTPTTEAPAVVQEENVSEFDLGQPSPSTEVTTETTAAPTYNWKDEIKKLDLKEVAKELGLNDFALEINEYMAKGGSAADYINAKGFNWNNISDEDLLKQELKQQFPEATDIQIQRVYNKKYNQRIEDLDEDREDGALLIKSDARKLRDEKIAKQNSFKIPEAIIPQVKDEAYEQWKQAQETKPALLKQLNEFYQNHEATKNLNQSKRVAINLGDGVPAFNFSVTNPEALTRMYTDGGETWQRLMNTQSGEPDVSKQHLLSLVAYNPQKVFQDIFNYGVQMGKKKLVEEGQNAQRPQQIAKPQDMNPTSYGVGKFSDKARA